MDFTNVKLGLNSLKNTFSNYDYGVIYGNNCAIGNKSLEENTKGFQNTALGSLSLKNNQESHNNTSVGFKSLFYSTEKYNTALGALTGKSLVNGKSNILIGKEADVSSSDAFNQIVIGTNATGLDNNSVTLGNIDTEDIYMSQGKSAIVHCGGLNIHNEFGEFSYCFPSNDGKKNNILKTDGKGNLRWTNDNSTSSFSLNNLTDCSTNVSNKNIFIGENVGANNTPGDGARDYEGKRNTALGIGSFATNTTGKFNVCFGSDTLNKNESGGYNIAIGHGALENNTSGDKNVAIGYLASDTIITGTNNTCLGYKSDVSSNIASNQIVIGNSTTGVADNSVTLGNTDITDVYMGQDSGAKVNCSGLRPNLVEANSDSEAATAGVAIGELYNNTGTVKVRLT